MQLTIGGLKGLKVSRNTLRALNKKAMAINKPFLCLLNEYVFEQLNAKRNEKNSINPIF